MIAARSSAARPLSTRASGQGGRVQTVHGSRERVRAVEHASSHCARPWAPRRVPAFRTAAVAAPVTEAAVDIAAERCRPATTSRSPLQCGVTSRPDAPRGSGWGPLPVRVRGARASLRSRTVARSGGGITLDLGQDILTFLTVTVAIIPLCKRYKVSPVLGYLVAGFVLKLFGALHNLEDIGKLSEIGVLFLLFEMGLELNTERLTALARYAFGVGLPQVVLTTALFTFLSLPGVGIGGKILESVLQGPVPLDDIRTVDEAVVIGAALSLSSSAFVLQLLKERGELPTRHGAGALGVLLMQDIVVVPLLVILPLIEAAGGLESDFGSSGLLQGAGPAALTSLGGLGLVVLASRIVLRKAFDVVAWTRSSEAFVSLCLLTVAGTSFLTDTLGFSDTLGAFLAGVLLAESNYRAQVEADIKPYKGILLGLFFLSTGAAVDVQTFLDNWPVILTLLGGLLVIKALVLTPVAKVGGNLSWADSVRLGILLSQGGEFAFVLLALANSLGVLNSQLNNVLLIVVVLSMALTPTLADGAKWASELVGGLAQGSAKPARDGASLDVLTQLEEKAFAQEPVVICGVGPVGMVVASMLTSPLSEADIFMQTAPGMRDAGLPPFVMLDYNVRRLRAAQGMGLKTVYYKGYAGRDILEAIGVERPTAVVVCYGNRAQSVETVKSVKSFHPGVPVLASAQNAAHAAELREAGADDVVVMSIDTGIELGNRLLLGMGVPGDETMYLVSAMREAPNSAELGSLGEIPQPPESALAELDNDTRADVKAIAKQLAAARNRPRGRASPTPPSSDGEALRPPGAGEEGGRDGAEREAGAVGAGKKGTAGEQS